MLVSLQTKLFIHLNINVFNIQSVSCKETEIFLFPDYFYKSLNIISFALSITELSNDARYIWVVLSESCPIPSLIIEIGIFLLFAILAHE